MLRFAFVCVVGLSSVSASAAAPLGSTIFKNQCAACHGAKGEGVAAEYSQALVGDKSVGELTELIERTMPADAPEKCVGADARAVAQFIYDEFYSPLAQARLRPARVELSRLTARQYRETVADLVGSYLAPLSVTIVKGKPVPPPKPARGWRGEYFPSTRFNATDRFLDRVDPVVQFDWKEGTPDPSEKADAAEFAVRWTGSVYAPVTGEYEFNARSENGVRLWVNDPRLPLIEASVRSGRDADHRETIRLLGGRWYAVKLEMFKSKNGKDKTASVSLHWTVPDRVEELLPVHAVSTAPARETFVLGTPLPPDDRSRGYELGSDVSKAWDSATTDGAIEAAGFVMARLDVLSGTNEKAPDRADRLRLFAERFVERAFRRPLSTDEKQLYLDRQFADAKRPEQAVERVVLLALKSPRFLYREFDPAADDPHSVASRLSFTLWDSLPDDELLRAAASGKLKTPEEIRAQAERMAADSRCRAKLREFLLQWLQVDHFGELAKDSVKFPDFDAALVADLRTSLDLTIDDFVNSDDADFRKLLTGDETWLNGRLANFYRVKAKADSTFERREFDREHRAGVLTHPLMLAGLAYTDVSSPIHRGVLISRSVLGRNLKPPPEAVAPLPADLHAGMTTRERVAVQTKDQACAACHTMINRIGFALENFDAVGRFRDKENGKPIDALGHYRTRDDRTVAFRGARELTAFLADSPETHAAVVERLFQFLTKQPILAYGLDAPAKLHKSFEERHFNLRKLAAEIAIAASRGVKPTTNLTSTSAAP